MQKIDVSVLFEFLGVSGQGVQKLEFDIFSTGCGVPSQTIDSAHPENPYPPAIHPPTHLTHMHTPFAPFTIPPVCSEEADCARSTASLGMILERILRSRSARAWSSSSFFVEMPPPRAVTRAPLSPDGGLVDRGELWHECVTCELS